MDNIPIVVDFSGGNARIIVLNQRDDRMPKFVDRTGQKFSRLTVVCRAESRILSGKLRTYWRCQCECGEEIEVLAESLVTGNTKSCGCAKNWWWSKTHALSKSKTYSAWAAAKSRCLNSDHPSYRHYGGRGIQMCKRWRDSFEAFLSDMGCAPGGLELDRIDNDGDYEPGNCRWTTRSEQLRNRRYLGRKRAA